MNIDKLLVEFSVLDFDNRAQRSVATRMALRMLPAIWDTQRLTEIDLLLVLRSLKAISVNCYFNDRSSVSLQTVEHQFSEFSKRYLERFRAAPPDGDVEAVQAVGHSLAFLIADSKENSKGHLKSQLAQTWFSISDFVPFQGVDETIFRSIVQNDVISAMHVNGLGTAFASRLWYPGSEFGYFEDYLQSTLEELNGIAGGERYWRQWYQGILDGEPLDWELQKEIVLIPNSEWKKGAERIADLIEEIRARFELRKASREADAFVNGGSGAEDVYTMLGHNHPPGSIDDLPFSTHNFQRVATAVSRIAKEAEEIAPDAKVIEVEAEVIETFTWRVANWFGSKLDKSAEEFFKALGKVGGVAFAGALGAYLLELLGYLRPLLDAVAKLLPFTGG